MTGTTPIYPLRLPLDMREALDRWIAAQPEPRPSRAEAIRQILSGHLSKV